MAREKISENVRLRVNKRIVLLHCGKPNEEDLAHPVSLRSMTNSREFEILDDF